MQKSAKNSLKIPLSDLSKSWHTFFLALSKKYPEKLFHCGNSTVSFFQSCTSFKKCRQKSTKVCHVEFRLEQIVRQFWKMFPSHPSFNPPRCVIVRHTKIKDLVISTNSTFFTLVRRVYKFDSVMMCFKSFLKLQRTFFILVICLLHAKWSLCCEIHLISRFFSFWLHFVKGMKITLILLIFVGDILQVFLDTGCNSKYASN